MSVEPRDGAAAPRVAEFPSGMLNAVGLANPGVESVRSEHLPWLAGRVKAARILVNVVGSRLEHFAEVVARLDGAAGVNGFELNVSCPNVRAGGTEFGADPEALAELVRRARQATKLPWVVKLSTLTPRAHRLRLRSRGAKIDARENDAGFWGSDTKQPMGFGHGLRAGERSAHRDPGEVEVSCDQRPSRVGGIATDRRVRHDGRRQRFASARRDAGTEATAGQPVARSE